MSGKATIQHVLMEGVNYLYKIYDFRTVILIQSYA